MTDFVPMMYYETFAVPVWVIVEDHDRAQKVIDWFIKREAKFVPSPAKGFMDTYMAFRQKGWGDMVDKTRRSVDLLRMAFTKHVKDQLNPILEFTPNNNLITRANRDLLTPQDMEQFFNFMLSTISNMDLCKMFMIQEICFPASKKGCKVFVSDGSIDPDLIRRLAKRVIKIGGEGSDLTYDQMGTKISTSLTDFMQAVMEEIQKLK